MASAIHYAAGVSLREQSPSSDVKQTGKRARLMGEPATARRCLVGYLFISSFFMLSLAIVSLPIVSLLMVSLLIVSSWAKTPASAA